MTLLLGDDDIGAVASMGMAIEAMEHAYGLADGSAGSPVRYDVALERGWLRLMVVEASGLGCFGYKAMNLFPGVGMRYAVHLYDAATGELDAIVDAKRITALRTAACSAVATDRLAVPEVTRTALIGTGAEARTQLLAMAAVRPSPVVAVHSRSDEHRRAFCEEMGPLVSARLEPCGSVAEATAGAELVVLATKSSTAVIGAAELGTGVHVSSVGAARLDQRELAADVFAVADLTVCDEVELVRREAGDAAAAAEAGAFDAARALSLAELVQRDPGRDGASVTLFKSVGSALQDLALAARVVEAARTKGLGHRVDGFLGVK